MPVFDVRQLPDARMHLHIKIMWHCAMPPKVKKWMTRMIERGQMSWDDLLQVTKLDLSRAPMTLDDMKDDSMAQKGTHLPYSYP